MEKLTLKQKEELWKQYETKTGLYANPVNINMVIITWVILALLLGLLGWLLTELFLYVASLFSAL